MNRGRITNPDKKYKDLKQKQKARISDFMYQETNRFLQERKRPPVSGEETVQVADRVYDRVQGLGIWIPYDEVLNEYRKKRPHILKRLEESGLPQHLLPKKELSPEEKKPKQAAPKRNKRKKPEPVPLPEQDNRFFFIAGYTSGGAPYGVTWEEMGLEPWEELK